MQKRIVVWGAVGLAVGVLALACGSDREIPDTPEGRRERAGQIARLEVAGGGLDETLNQGATFAQAYSVDELRLELKRELTDEEQERVFSILRSVLAEFLTPSAWEEVLSQVYAEHLTVAELDDVLRFFESGTGQKLLQMESRLSQQISESAEAILGGRLEEFIERVDVEMASAFDLPTGETP